jgi:hypothetical protein
MNVIIIIEVVTFKRLVQVRLFFFFFKVMFLFIYFVNTLKNIIMKLMRE